MEQERSYGLRRFTVGAMEEVARDVWLLEAHVPEVARAIRPGQFMNLEVPGDHSHLLRVPLSFAEADPEAGDVQIVFAAVGEGTRRLAAMREGESSTMVGPLGHGWRPPAASARGGRALLVAGGVGLPPIVACCGMLRAAGLEADVVVGAKTEDALWKGGIERLKELGATAHVATDDGSYGEKGFTTGPAARLLADRDYAAAYTCGPQPMMAGIARLCAEAHVPLQASLERMMTCGFGACNTCNVALAKGGYASCCSDGPVFDAEEVAW